MNKEFMEGQAENKWANDAIESMDETEARNKSADSALLGCPFCGEDSKLINIAYGTWRAGCVNDDCKIHPQIMIEGKWTPHDETGSTGWLDGGQAKKDVIKAWNTRAYKPNC